MGRPFELTKIPELIFTDVEEVVGEVFGVDVLSTKFSENKLFAFLFTLFLNSVRSYDSIMMVFDLSK